MELSFGYGPSDWREILWCEIYDKAVQKGKAHQVQLGDWEFEFALINPKDRYGSPKKSTKGEEYRYGSNATFWIKDAEKEGNIGRNEGNLSFVLENETPQHFQSYVGLHEMVEANLGKQAHSEACLIELDEVMRREPEFIQQYAEWILSLSAKSRMKADYESLRCGYFGRAIPEFLTYLVETKDRPSEILRRFHAQIEEKLRPQLEQQQQIVSTLTSGIASVRERLAEAMGSYEPSEHFSEISTHQIRQRLVS